MSAFNDISCEKLKGIGPETSQFLRKIGLHSLRHLLLHLPTRYEDRATITPIAQLVAGEVFCIQGTVVSQRPEYGRTSSLTVTLKDQSGTIRIVFFGHIGGPKAELVVGQHFRMYGRVKTGKVGFEMPTPDYIQIGTDGHCQWDQFVMPVYGTTQGFSQAKMRRVMKIATSMIDQLEFPETITPYSSMSLKEAFKEVHSPSVGTDVHALNARQSPSQARLIIDELVAQQLSMKLRKDKVKTQLAPELKTSGALINRFMENIQFELTNAQQRVLAEIAEDMSTNQPMLRLVQGDVGSGKTLVAAISGLSAISNGYQVVMMAPTELLADQHAINFARWFEPLGITVVCMSGTQGKRALSEKLDDIASGKAHIVIGTHALFQKNMIFKKVGLVIIDEQHRFGVEQRLALMSKAGSEFGIPHQLVMTATPIPRTLTMTACADLDVSIIDELPPGRTPVVTVVKPDSSRLEIAERVLHMVKEKKQQVYWVCPLVEESEKIQIQAAESLFMELHNILPDVRIGLVHGRLKSKDKTDIMQKFSAYEIDVLVATTVIEVGVDVPNATLMIIENADRLGLAQLHQLRGRVGRGNLNSFCILLYNREKSSKTARDRLNVIRGISDGFEVAQHDLRIRGAGDVLGIKQSGNVDYHIANLDSDADLIPIAIKIANDFELKEKTEELSVLTSFWFDEQKSYLHV